MVVAMSRREAYGSWFDNNFTLNTRVMVADRKEFGFSVKSAKTFPGFVLSSIGRITLSKCEENRKVMQGILEQNRIAAATINRTSGSFGQKIGFMASLFGCWHKRLTRPFTEKHTSYRACLDCGARKKFNTEEFRTTGPFYYPPSVRSESV